MSNIVNPTFPVVRVHLEDKVYPINVEFGTQDVSWLAITACYLHGRNNYPAARYIPILAKNKNKEILHPRMVILKYSNKIGEDIYITIQKSSQEARANLTKDEKDWYNQAFGKDKYMMTVNFKFYPSLQELKYNIPQYFIKFKFSVFPQITQFSEYKVNDIHDVCLALSTKSNEYFEKEIQLPYGEVTVQKIYYKEKEDNIKEVSDMNKNKIVIEKFPDPLLNSDKEEIIKKKELDILYKERELQVSIKKIEQEKYIEEERITELRNFLESIPFSLDDVYYMTISNITNSEADLDPIFEIFHKNEFTYFKKLYQIFDEYSVYYNEDLEYGEFICLDAIKNFFITFFNKNKSTEYESINNTFKYFYLDRKTQRTYRFNDFMFCLVYCLYYNNNINSLDLIPEHLDYIFEYYNEKCSEESFKLLYKDTDCILVIKENLYFLKNLFYGEAKETPLPYYKELTLNEISKIFAYVFSNMQNLNFIEMLKGIKYDRGVNFFSFLELLCVMSLELDFSLLKNNNNVLTNNNSDSKEKNKSNKNISNILENNNKRNIDSAKSKQSSDSQIRIDTNQTKRTQREQEIEEQNKSNINIIPNDEENSNEELITKVSEQNIPDIRIRNLINLLINCYPGYYTDALIEKEKDKASLEMNIKKDTMMSYKSAYSKTNNSEKDKLNKTNNTYCSKKTGSIKSDLNHYSSFNVNNNNNGDHISEHSESSNNHYSANKFKQTGNSLNSMSKSSSRQSEYK